MTLNPPLISILLLLTAPLAVSIIYPQVVHPPSPTRFNSSSPKSCSEAFTTYSSCWAFKWLLVTKWWISSAKYLTHYRLSIEELIIDLISLICFSIKMRVMAAFLNPAGFLSDQVNIPAESGHHPGGSENQAGLLPWNCHFITHWLVRCLVTWPSGENPSSVVFKFPLTSSHCDITKYTFLLGATRKGLVGL